ncbi:MAG TPA: fasciclin domain-containing protein [Solirubrobacteraceae bacterium]
MQQNIVKTTRDAGSPPWIAPVSSRPRSDRANPMKHIRKLLLIAGAAAALATLVPLASARPVGKRNIVQTAVAAKQFKTLVALVKQAGLAETLEGKGPFTVFAPTDAAFAKVPHSTLVALGHDRSKLRAVLLYHVLKGKVTAARLVKLHSVKTLNGQSLKIHVNHGTVTIGGARIIETNIAASNGVIHVINQVLIPR